MRKVVIAICIVIAVVMALISYALSSANSSVERLGFNQGLITTLPVQQAFYCNILKSQGNLESMVANVGPYPDPNAPKTLLFKFTVEASPTQVRPNLIVIYKGLMSGKINPTLLSALDRTSEILCNA